MPLTISLLTKRQVLRLDATDVEPSSFANENIEYIRKEAILEWAKEYKVELLDSAKTMDTDSVGKCINSGALTMLDNVIDKIESL